MAEERKRGKRGKKREGVERQEEKDQLVSVRPRPPLQYCRIKMDKLGTFRSDLRCTNTQINNIQDIFEGIRHI